MWIERHLLLLSPCLDLATPISRIHLQAFLMFYLSAHLFPFFTQYAGKGFFLRCFYKICRFVANMPGKRSKLLLLAALKTFYYKLLTCISDNLFCFDPLTKPSLSLLFSVPKIQKLSERKTLMSII